MRLLNININKIWPIICLPVPLTFTVVPLKHRHAPSGGLVPVISANAIFNNNNIKRLFKIIILTIIMCLITLQCREYNTCFAILI